MTFLQIPANAAVFIDANIFVYHFTPDPNFGPACPFASRVLSPFTSMTMVFIVSPGAKLSAPVRAT
jgi:hypothetical protein